MVTRGILVGSDANSEWLLPIWWRCYSLHFRYPVAFVDFGLTEAGKQFCREHGELIPIEVDMSLGINRTDPANIIIANVPDFKFKAYRTAWFKKPFACFLSPFDETIWLDIDCLILKDLSPLFELLTPDTDIALVREIDFIEKMVKDAKILDDDEPLYNSGVIIFSKKSRAIQNWIRILYEGNYIFPGDQDALSKAISINKTRVSEAPKKYNWPWCFAQNKDAHILHFLGPEGKDFLKSNIFI